MIPKSVVQVAPRNAATIIGITAQTNKIIIATTSPAMCYNFSRVDCFSFTNDSNNFFFARLPESPTAITMKELIDPLKLTLLEDSLPAIATFRSKIINQSSFVGSEAIN